MPETFSDGVNDEFNWLKFSDVIVVEIFGIVEFIPLDALAGVGEMESSPRRDVRVVGDGIPLNKDSDEVIGDSDIVTDLMGLVDMGPTVTVFDTMSKLDMLLALLEIDLGCCVAADMIGVDFIDNANASLGVAPSEFIDLLPLLSNAVDMP